MIEHSIYQNDLLQINQLDLPWTRLHGKNILITGASGLIGSVIVDALIYRNENFHANIHLWLLSRNEETVKQRFGSYFKKPYFHSLIQDVSKKISIDVPIDYIIHGASKGDPYSFATDPVGIMNANYLGMMNVLELARENKTEKVIFISTGEIYGIIDTSIGYQQLKAGIREDNYGFLDILNHRSSYAGSKRAAETLCLSYKYQYGLNVSIARPCHTYGPTLLDSDSRAIGEFIRKGMQKKDIVLKSQGLQKRSYTYVTDTASGIFYILLKGENGEAYNIANKNSVTSIADLAHLIAEITGTKVIYDSANDFERKGYSDIMHAVLDSGKLESLGWKPEIGLRDGIKRMIEILAN